jgi:16S rRNA U1498 N3-methylase RsmE
LLDIQTFGLVGPEWGLTERDYEALKGIDYEVRELGETMLRTETAAIVGGWIIRSSPKGLK